jgi:hypothetical protein
MTRLLRCSAHTTRGIVKFKYMRMTRGPFTRCLHCSSSSGLSSHRHRRCWRCRRETAPPARQHRGQRYAPHSPTNCLCDRHQGGEIMVCMAFAQLENHTFKPFNPPAFAVKHKQMSRESATMRRHKTAAGASECLPPSPLPLSHRSSSTPPPLTHGSRSDHSPLSHRSKK